MSIICVHHLFRKGFKAARGREHGCYNSFTLCRGCTLSLRVMIYPFARGSYVSPVSRRGQPQSSRTYFVEKPFCFW